MKNRQLKKLMRSYTNATTMGKEHDLARYQEDKQPRPRSRSAIMCAASFVAGILISLSIALPITLTSPRHGPTTITLIQPNNPLYNDTILNTFNINYASFEEVQAYYKTSILLPSALKQPTKYFFYTKKSGEMVGVESVIQNRFFLDDTDVQYFSSFVQTQFSEPVPGYENDFHDAFSWNKIPVRFSDWNYDQDTRTVLLSFDLSGFTYFVKASLCGDISIDKLLNYVFGSEI